MKTSNNLFLLMLSIASLLSACNRSSSPGNPGAPQSTSTTPIIQSQNDHGDGGIDSGGGDYVGSDAEQIKAIFRGDNGFNLKDSVKSAFKSVEFQVLNKSLNQDAESIFSRMLGPKFSGDSFDIFQDIEKSPYDLKESGPCLESQLNSKHAGHSKDASTKMNEKGASICFSLEGLKRLPIQAVPFQIVALAIHEHAHHYGFDEADAVIAQKEALTLLNSGLLNRLHMDVVSKAGSVRDTAKHILNNLNTGFSDKLICKHLSALSSAASDVVDLSVRIDQQFEVRMLVTALDHNFPVDKESLKGADEVYQQTRAILYFCGEDKTVDATYSKKVPEGDRKSLKTQLELLYETSHKIVLQATSAASRRASSQKY